MPTAGDSRRLTVEEALLVREAEARIERRLAEVETAHDEGKLWDLVRNMPSVEEQLKSFRSTSE